MTTKLFAALLLGTTMLSGTAMAQTTPPAPAPAPAATSMPAPAGDAWRALKFSGLDVYNDKDEKIGDIAELMMTKDGKIDSVVVSVGGFLGMGQHDVAIKFTDLKFMTEPRRPATTSSAPATGATTGAATGTTATTAAARPAEPKNFPEYAVLANATKDSLKAMPAYKY